MIERVFTFDTTHHALWAEEVATESGVPVEVVPAPDGSEAKCDLALRTFPDRIPELERLFQQAGISFRLYPS